ncbi:trypsin-like peptidase domain-containing protein [Fibrella forsythiae]|uniref:Trypsin-like peptidase domain-containing protein n=1 Tax=Fibrella forsythiae TaxID=2817061 RepID=A0ABS3JN04_9BACT|nr:trypsin-like peptidase domain-containing protein [Fibrella forsythiae]MBO0951398.1 trypsin-like peptidase domain-containing protein [Fibrella forsythiae]
MFADAIDLVDPFTRPIHSIIRLYGHNEVIPGSATLFFVNDEACAITCKHVAELIVQSDSIFGQFNAFRAELRQFQRDKNYAHLLQKLETKYGFKGETVIRVRNMFMNCVDQFTELKVDLHPLYDLALIRFIGYNRTLYKGHATFLRDSSRARPGRSLCRLGYPFPEFTNYRYNEPNDDIEWVSDGRDVTPKFPIDGIITRLLSDNGTNVTGIELSTPGLRGQSGGPLFDVNGLVYGMQAETRHLHLGFDIEGRDVMVNGRKARVSNYPFLNVGACVHVDVIKRFLSDHNVAYSEG